MKKERGITLIALVITIIVLIILAGISINLLLGENGIITKAKSGKGDYQEASLREKVEMALVDYNSDKIVRGEEGQIEEALNKLLDKGIFDDIEIEEKIGMTDDYEITLGKEKGEVIIEGVDKITGELRLRCRLNTREYTKKDVTIFVKSVGNVVKVIKPDSTEEQAVKGKVEINYLVSQNGNYVFKAEDINGNVIEKTVIVNNIDTLPPKEFTIEAKFITGTGFSINAEAEDSEATERSACSGIDRYEYFVKRVEEENYPERPYTTNEITGLSQGTYQVYVVVYDKAGNSKESRVINVKIVMKVAKVATGRNYALIIDKEGNLYGIGRNYYGNLGDGTTIDRKKLVKIMEGTKFKEVTTMSRGSCYAIDIEGNLWGWGNNENYQLGDGTNNTRLVPIKIKEGTKFKRISGGISHALAIDEDGKLWTWGKAGKYPLKEWWEEPNSAVPVPILSDMNFKEIVAGNCFNLAIDKDGYLWAWGHNGYGSLGDGTTIDRYTIVPIKNEMKFKEIVVGSDVNSIFAIDEEGKLWGWGENAEGELGVGTVSKQISPIIIKEGTKFKKGAICIGGDSNVAHSLIIDENGNLWACGRNTNSGVLGNNSKLSFQTPVLIKNGTKFKEVACSRHNSYAIDEEGNLWAWGDNEYGLLLNETVPLSRVPIQCF